MSKGGFGDYLIGKGVITEKQHEIALKLQNKQRLLGEIAIEENYLTREEVSEILRYTENNPEVQFGEAAISLAYFTSNQLQYLLDIRTRRKVRIGDILVQEQFITEEVLHKEVMEFDSKRKRIKTILVCEPSKIVASIIEEWLTKYGYTVLRADNGKDAFKLAQETKPDVLMTSSILPDMDGPSLCIKMLTNPKTTGIRSVLLSSVSEKENIEQAFEAGVNHFLKKPVESNELINVLYQLERGEAEKKLEKILIVDDSAGARFIINKELSSTWANIYMVENGQKAVEKALEIKPDIITMDVTMPIMNGFEACKRLKEDPATEDIPVIMVTSSDSMAMREKGFKAGAVEYFSKPFQPGLLTSFIKMVIETKKISKKERILVADDSKTTRHILKYFFTKNGYTVYTAGNGEEAIELLPKCSPDLLITDCFMPKMDGFDLTRQIRKMDDFRNLPIIMITASTAKSDVLKGLAAGANDQLVKPFDESELLARVSTHLRNRALLEQAERDKKKLEKLNEEKDKFIGIAAHDLRNPLDSITGFAKLLREDNLDENTRKKFLGIIESEGENMLSLLDNLLDISKIESGKVSIDRQSGNLCELIRERVNLAEFVAKHKKVSIQFSCPEKIEMPIDKLKTEQIIDNLLSNAIKYSEHGKTVYVSVEDYVTNAKVTVKDEGLGIPDDEQSKLFTPFANISTVPTAGEKSSGLGLSIVARIIKAHGGEIGVESKVGTGSSFFFSLPKV